jgi:hypothetical protein
MDPSSIVVFRPIMNPIGRVFIGVVLLGCLLLAIIATQTGRPVAALVNLVIGLLLTRLLLPRVVLTPTEIQVRSTLARTASYPPSQISHCDYATQVGKVPVPRAVLVLKDGSTKALVDVRTGNQRPLAEIIDAYDVIGGHENSPGTVMGSPRGRPLVLPRDGRGNSPWTVRFSR